VPTLNFAANAEVDLLEIFFNGNVNTSQVRLAQLPNGGITGPNAGNYQFYLAFNGTDRVNQPAQFYGTGSFNSGLGYAGYGYASVNGVALPLRWLTFSAQKQNGNAIVKWEVANQVNNDYFEIEAGKDAALLSTIGKVESVVNKSVYQFTDANILKRGGEYVYYRIKQVDKEGKFTYSEIKKISISGTDFSFGVITNPIRGRELKINLQSHNNSKGTLRIFDLYGKQVYLSNVTWTAGYSEQIIQLPELAKGSYVASLSAGTEQYQAKFVK
jgi:hypothetical protein